MKGNLSTKGSCIIRLQTLQQALMPAEKRIADFVLCNSEKVVALTIEELAAESKSSYATITRFCKRLGYSGYKEFKSSLINDVISSKGVEDLINNQAININASTEEIFRKTYSLAMSILEDGYKILDPATIDRVVDKIISAGSINIIGSGYSGVSARYADSKFFRIGLPSIFEMDLTLSRMKIAIMTEHDVLFAISSSGRTASVIEAVRMAKKNGVTVVSLSDYAVSPLTKSSDLNLFTTPRNSNLFMNIDMPLITGQIAIIDVLYSCCCVRLSERASSIYEKTKVSADAEKLS